MRSSPQNLNSIQRNRERVCRNIARSIPLDFFPSQGVNAKPKIPGNMNEKSTEAEKESTRMGLNAESIRELWSKTYNTEGKPDWSHILPYYDDSIYFRDSIQGLRGMQEFKAMTERLTDRSNDLKMHILRTAQQGKDIFIEWEMTIQFKRNPSSVLYGSSRVTLNEEGRIIEQRDYYDLWGDIFDNITRFGKAYRRFMKRKFG
jgi:limonene-1,2-epoxide hydrolase